MRLAIKALKYCAEAHLVKIVPYLNFKDFCLQDNLIRNDSDLLTLPTYLPMDFPSDEKLTDKGQRRHLNRNRSSLSEYFFCQDETAIIWLAPQTNLRVTKNI